MKKNYKHIIIFLWASLLCASTPLSLKATPTHASIENDLRVPIASVSISKSSKTTEYALDPATLNKMADYLSPSNASKLESIGGVEGLKNFLKQNGDVPCGNCTSGKPVFNGRGMDEMIENFVEVGHAYREYAEFCNKLKSGAEHTLDAMREGTQHTLEMMRKNPGKYAPIVGTTSNLNRAMAPFLPSSKAIRMTLGAKLPILNL